MEKLHADKISEWVQGKLDGDAKACADKAATDTRTMEAGSLYFAIRGERFDGHQFIEKAFEKGASIVVSEISYSPPPGCAVIIVKDTVKALGDLARRYLEAFPVPVVGITGSTGKTSTKDMITQLLSTQYVVHKTMGNFNNHIGLPLSVLSLTRNHTAAVFEMGMSGPGEIEYLSGIIRPDLGVITNIGISHIEKLGSRQNILRAKLEMIKGMKENGRLVLNGDDELLSGLEGLLPMPVIFYGINENIRLHAFGIESLGEAGVRFTVKIRGEEVEIRLPAPGIHNVSNALAAIACALELGISNENIQKGLAEYSQEKMRLSITHYDGVKVINDAYNAAPASMAAALAVLRDIAGKHRSIAVLGDMLELGDFSQDAHRQTGGIVAQQQIHSLVAIGELARDYVNGALERGMNPENTKHFSSVEMAIKHLKEFIQPDDVILFKGSRGMNLDAVIEALFGS
ncbi:MAG: UDP-N-acetylmuramoyl-tripeptide--D-alanyl-D-alanine ligase [Clostridiaceae bacterium]|nr:UDP-N-acetylmuramoyl-tripeptide--D-alanyl-D-alanine ligase [Clostridiaceae bacterium]